MLGLLLMCVAAWLVSRHAHFRFIEIALATVVLGNVAAHVLGSLVTWTYSPGLVTGVVVWTSARMDLRLRSAWEASTRKARRAGNLPRSLGPRGDGGGGCSEQNCHTLIHARGAAGLPADPQAEWAASDASWS